MVRGINRLLIAFSVLATVLPFWILGAPTAHAAASFYFSPSSIKVNVGQTATVTLLVNTDQAINSAGGTIVLPELYSTPVSVSKSGSVLTTWPEEPTISGSTIKFSGGLPTPGYTGSGGKILSFVVKGKAEGTGVITISGAKLLANDGKGTNITSGSASATITVSRTVSGAVISSSTHPNPNNWYNKKDAQLTWTKPAGTVSYSYTLSSDSGATGQSQASTTAQQASFTNLADGVWTFSLTAKFSDGKTTVSSYTIRVDTTPPEAFTFKVEQAGGSTDPYPVVSYLATDKLSGIDHYEIIVDSDSPITTTDTTYKLPRQKPGSHRIAVRAFDKAGNSIDGTPSPGFGQFNLQGFAGPTITSHPAYVATLQPITFKGKALFGATVHLYVDGKDVAQFVVRENLTEAQRQSIDTSNLADDQTVEWTYTYKGVLWPGKHKFYAIQVKPDTSESDLSNEVVVRVLAGSISIGQIIIPMLLVVISLLMIVSVLLLLLILFYRKNRGKFISWRRRLLGLKSQIDNEMEHLEDKVEDEVDKSVEKSRELRHEVTEEVKKAQDAIDQSIDTLTKDAGKEEETKN